MNSRCDGMGFPTQRISVIYLTWRFIRPCGGKQLKKKINLSNGYVKLNSIHSGLSN
jgi:hypothetical protein